MTTRCDLFTQQRLKHTRDAPCLAVRGHVTFRISCRQWGVSETLHPCHMSFYRGEGLCHTRDYLAVFCIIPTRQPSKNKLARVCLVCLIFFKATSTELWCSKCAEDAQVAYFAKLCQGHIGKELSGNIPVVTWHISFTWLLHLFVLGLYNSLSYLVKQKVLWFPCRRQRCVWRSWRKKMGGRSRKNRRFTSAQTKEGR